MSFLDEVILKSGVHNPDTEMSTSTSTMDGHYNYSIYKIHSFRNYLISLCVHGFESEVVRQPHTKHVVYQSLNQGTFVRSGGTKYHYSLLIMDLWRTYISIQSNTIDNLCIYHRVQLCWNSMKTAFDDIYNIYIRYFYFLSEIIYSRLLQNTDTVYIL